MINGSMKKMKNPIKKLKNISNVCILLNSNCKNYNFIVSKISFYILKDVKIQ